jgi:hypothetical protein
VEYGVVMKLLMHYDVPGYDGYGSCADCARYGDSVGVPDPAVQVALRNVIAKLQAAVVAAKKKVNAALYVDIESTSTLSAWQGSIRQTEEQTIPRLQQTLDKAASSEVQKKSWLEVATSAQQQMEWVKADKGGYLVWKDTTDAIENATRTVVRVVLEEGVKLIAKSIVWPTVSEILSSPYGWLALGGVGIWLFRARIFGAVEKMTAKQTVTATPAGSTTGALARYYRG